MPKMKTRKTVAKRFRKSGTGKLMHVHPNKKHILTKKTRKRKRQLRGSVALNTTGSYTKYVSQVVDH